jgi:hypothetical protein
MELLNMHGPNDVRQTVMYAAGIVSLVAMEIPPKLYTSLSIDQILIDLFRAAGKTRSDIHKSAANKDELSVQ